MTQLVRSRAKDTVQTAHCAVDSGVTEDGGVTGLMLFDPGRVNSSFIAKYLTILELS